MSRFIVFTKKELLEQLRSYKLPILAAVLFLFGMLSPLLAKMMPDIFAKMQVQGITIHMPKPTLFDAWAQYFKNMGQMGLIALLLIFGSMLSQELSRGTLIIPLSKGLPRGTVIFSKFTAALLSWSLTFSLSAATAYGYTCTLFKTGPAPRLLFALFCLWLFGCLILSLLLLGGALVSEGFGGLLITVGIIGVMLIVSMFPKTRRWNPISLASLNGNLLTDPKLWADMTCAAIVTAVLIAVSLAAALGCFYRKRI